MQARRLKKGITRNRGNSKVLFPSGTWDASERPVNQPDAQLEQTGLTVAGRGMRMVHSRRVPIGADKYQTDFATEVAIGEAAKLLRMLVKVEDVQAIFQIMRMSAS